MPRVKRSKITVSIDPPLVAKVDELVKLRIYRNRSHAFEVALSRLLNNRDAR